MKTKAIILILAGLAVVGCQRPQSVPPRKPSVTTLELQNQTWDHYRALHLRGIRDHTIDASRP
jgi:hypothetical protein